MKKVLLFVIIINIIISGVFPYVEKVDLNEGKRYNQVLRSAIYPGIVQYNRGEQSKGYFFSILTSLCVLGAIYSYKEANRDYDKYQNLQYRKDELYDSYSKNMDQMYGFIGVGVIVWIYNVYDAYKNSKELQDNDSKFKVGYINNKLNISYSKRY